MRLVCGVGINDVNYVVQIKEVIGREEGKLKQRLVWICPDYQDWKNMLQRCYSEREKQKNPTYRDVTCVEEWHRLSVFKQWRALQGDVSNKQLDKDIIVPGNKLYSPETCAYVNKMTNSFVVACDAVRGEWPIGVSWNNSKAKFEVYCSNPFTKKREYFGVFTNPLEAHEAWRERKHELAQLVAATESDPRIIEALKKRYSEEEWYK